MKKSSVPPRHTDTRPASFPIVGIGASAGGLEALEQFFHGVPADSGLAYVVVQHLDPTHKDLLVELLQRGMAMPVLQAADGQLVQPNHVYVIPPNADLALRHGKLYLQSPAAPRGLRLPIDFFLRSLAAERKGSAVAVILSGMGSDGTLGLGAVKEQGGAVFVQDPATAKFDGMPRSAIATSQADAVAPAGLLGAAILSCTLHMPKLPALVAPNAREPDLDLLEQVIGQLRQQCGPDFSQYKTSTLQRRIERRMALHQLTGLADYVAYLRENPHEAGLLFKELLIGVTNFFRDPPVWAQLQAEVIPALLAAHPKGAALRAWVPACSTGEEAYSLAMLFLDALDALRPSARFTLQIFGTDLDSDAIDRARAGVYPANIAADVSEARLLRYFVQEGDGYRICKAVREMVIFAPQNVVMDPPFTKLDLLTCRNLLIYLETNLQRKLLPLFHFSLRAGGYLVLGSAETVGTEASLFSALSGKTRIYQRRDVPLRPEPVEFPAVRYGRARGPVQESPLSIHSTPSAVPNVQALTDALLLQKFAPAAVLVTDQGDIVYFSGRTGKYLEPAAGKANLNIFAMAREGLAAALNEVFARVVREKGSHILNDVKVGQDGSSVQVNVALQYVREPSALYGMVLIVFHEQDAPALAAAHYSGALPDALAERMAAMSREVQQARAELQKAREDMQGSQEELKSTNEELQSTNEELQSTNEELTTSKEELQSMNEELQTVNHELQSKVDELCQASDDMENLLNSTDIATLFLDEELRIRRFTNRVSGIIKLIPGDAGRPITDLVSLLDYPALAEDAQEVLRKLVYRETEVSSRDGRWFLVRIMPYRTQDKRIDGVVITFVDVSAAKALELALRRSRAEGKD